MGEGEGYQYSSELKIERVNYYISYYISIWRHTHVILRDKQSTTGRIYLILMDPLIILSCEHVLVRCKITLGCIRNAQRSD